MAEVIRKIEDDTRVRLQPTNKGVQLANRLDLHRLSSFVENSLPHRSDLHNLVLAALNWVTNPASVYIFFIRNNSDEEQTLNHNSNEFSAIVAIRVDQSQSRNRPEKLAKGLNSVSWFREDKNKESLFRIWDSIGAIDWNDDIVSLYAMKPSESIPEILAEHLNKKGVSLELHPGYHYEMERKTALNLQIPEIKDVYVKSLEKIHASTVYSYWPYKPIATEDDVMDQIDSFPSAGVFLKDNDQLVSWMVFHMPWGMGKLHTLEEHRKKGYASLVTKYLSKRMAQSGYIPYVNIEVGNDTSCAFFESVGFKNCGEKPHFIQEFPLTVKEAILKNFGSLNK